MNFPPFGGHFSTAIPTIHQFAAKFSQETAAGGAGAGPLCQSQDTSNRYTANGVPSFTQHHPATQQQMLNKYQGGYASNQPHAYAQQQEKRHGYEPQELAQELCAAMLQQEKQNNDKSKHEAQSKSHHSHAHSNQQNQALGTASSMPASWQSLATPGSAVADYLSHLPASTLPLSLHHFLKYSAESMKKETGQQLNIQASPEPNVNLLHNSSINMNGNGLSGGSGNLAGASTSMNNIGALTTINSTQIQNVSPTKKKKKKKPEKEKKPRPKPGEIRLTTALDGSTLYCCPECHMAYPEKELLEQHLVGHTLERRFVCDICGAGLKRKDHLTRHKQSHNPERPYVCTVCLKAFKRKEQLTLHFVIHSGEKRHVCTECGKGFYRKDHLRKHTRSHIARRVKAELSQQGNPSQALQLQVGASSAGGASSGILP
ncbi:hypothetical protein NQ315_001489 [Exocentrus adspersus]|uniref:C2H2-type domain-containing protein n=1 Tax=Exocentrus adspersus TaxID=1586481 RepID=A0AAV8W8G1_9CUCU|nr:hypothetical protein NQ315_001489 [Exocentrus adspersus]